MRVSTGVANGTVIYSTRVKNNPLNFLLGGNQVIAGVDEGVTGMRVGERRNSVVPPALSKRSSYPENTPPLRRSPELARYVRLKSDSAARRRWG